MARYVIDKRFSTFFRPRTKDRIAQLLTFAGVETSPEVWIGSRILIVLLFGLVGAIIPFSVLQYIDLSAYPILKDPTLPARIILSFVTAAAFSVIAGILIYMHLYYLVTERTQRVERVLPDFLVMVAATLRSGMTPFSAFQASSRPEFGPLQSEIIYVPSRSLGSESFSEALRGLTTTIDSAMLRRMIALFENELKSGGKLAHLLETSAEEIRETEEIKRQMMIATKSYAIFLGFILVFGLPLLLSISTQFLSIFTDFQKNIVATGDTAKIAGLSSPKLSVDSGFIEAMAFVIIVGTSILTSVLIGVIGEGKILYGLKFFPPLALGSIVMFIIFKTVISGFVGELI